MFQDFHFKIVHRTGVNHSNVDALNKNIVRKYKVDEDFGNQIQDLGGISQENPIYRKKFINLFIVMEGDSGNYSEEVLEKGK